MPPSAVWRSATPSPRFYAPNPRGRLRSGRDVPHGGELAPRRQNSAVHVRCGLVPVDHDDDGGCALESGLLPPAAPRSERRGPVAISRGCELRERWVSLVARTRTARNVRIEFDRARGSCSPESSRGSEGRVPGRERRQPTSSRRSVSGGLLEARASPSRPGGFVGGTSKRDLAISGSTGGIGRSSTRRL